ncbi:MAG: sulfatase [Phycisphaerae bacterium]|nr:sulfatase [Phycisphaerae bacterium]
MNRREFLKVSGVAVSMLPYAGCLASKTAARKSRPNIVFIMTDDHASHAISCYGSKINTTPHLDRLAVEGMRFNNCFCTNAICAPSRAVILTGKYSHLNGKIDNSGQPFDGTQQTYPKLLRQAGYETAMIGKWHLKSNPTGFDYWNILPGQGDYFNPDFIEMGRRKQHEGYVTDLTTDFAMDWVKNCDKDKPFCLMLHHKAPHRNWQPDEKHKKAFVDKQFPLPETFNDDYSTRCDAARQQEMTVEKHLTPGDIKVKTPKGLEGQALKEWKYQRYMQDYLACVASVDDNVGRFLDFLDAEGLTDNTVVFYTSDQGFYLGDHGWFDKRFMYEESLRMPLLVRWPNVVKAGSVNDDMVLNLDFAETFLDIAGVDVSAEMQGESMKPILLGKTPDDWRQAMYYHYYEYPGWHQVKRHYGIRTKRYKLIHFYYDIDCWELYDLQKDPHELMNLYDNPAYADIVKDLKVRLRQLQAKYKDSDELAQSLLPKEN